MGATKQSSKKKGASREAGPKVSRPYMPGYGIPKDKKNLLDWSDVSARLAEAKHYWVCTVSPDGRPHATPVDGLWIDGKLYFGGDPRTRRNRNLAENPAVCIHLESGIDVVILHGEAQQLRSPDRSLAVRLADASLKKYGFAPKPQEYETSTGIFVFHPRMVLAWRQFPKDATRWHFQSEA